MGKLGRGKGEFYKLIPDPYPSSAVAKELRIQFENVFLTTKCFSEWP